MSWLSGLFSSGAGNLAESVGKAAIDIRSAITGDLPPELRARLEEQATGLLEKQIEINVQEAKHTSLFVAGWRPFVGWVCGFGVAYQFLFRPFAVWVSSIYATFPAPPVLDSAEIVSLLAVLLGAKTLRTVEKVKNVNNRH